MGTKLASVKLYFTPDDTPSGRKPHHGQDELLVADEKVVLEIEDLVKWILESPVDWIYGFQISAKSPEFAEKRAKSSSPQTINGYQRHDDTIDQSRVEPVVIVVSFPQYCRYRAMAKRLEKMSSSWLQNVIVQAISGMSVTGGDVRLMFCQETFEHPVLTIHDFRKDCLAPKLKGRKRRKKFSRQESVESVDSDLGADKLVAMTADDVQFKPTVKRSTKFGLALPQLGLELISSGKEAFEQRLYKFMRERKTPIKRIPSLGFKEVDLFQFFMCSQKYGGYDKVTEGRHWKHIYDQMGGHPGNTSAATCTRRIYEKLLLTFERHIRGEEDKPMPVTYMRPARKKLQEQQSGLLHNVQSKAFASRSISISSSSDFLSADQNADPLLKMTEVETGTVAEAETEHTIEDVDCVQTALVHHESEVPREKSPHPRHELKSGSSLAKELKSRKDNSLLDAALPGPTSELSSASSLAVGSSCQTTHGSDPSHRPSSAMSIFCTESVPWYNGDNTMPISSQTSKQFATISSSSSRPSLAKVVANESLESSKISSIGGACSTLDCVETVLERANSETSTEQKSVFKECAILTPECIPSYMSLASPLTRTGLTFIRPTYGPPNVINSPPVLPNGHNEFFRSKLCTHFEKPLLPDQSVFSVDSTGVPSVGENTLVCKDPREKTPPGKCETVGTSGSWFNSPIKQFLDRTRAMSSTLRLNDADDQPVDLSMKSLNVLGKTETHSPFMNGLHKEQEEPLNLSKKGEQCYSRRGGTKAKTVTTEVAVPSKKSLLSLGDAGKVILPKSSDQFVPLILSVPSLTAAAAPHSVVMSNVSSLSLASFTNKSAIMKSGFTTVPAVLPTSPFPTSLIGTAIRPVLQFFPSPSIALSSEGGRPLLLRFPMPMPVSTPVSATQTSILAPKTNRS